MGRVTLTVAARDYDVNCRDGEEAHFRALAKLVDDKATEAARGLGGMTETRLLMFAALLLADELDQARAAAAIPVAPAPPPIDPSAIERLAARAEALAERLEHGGRTS